MSLCANCFTELGESKIECDSCGAEMHMSCKNTCEKCEKTLCDECALEGKHCNDEKDEEPANQIDKIRRSHIELYKTCPYAFYLEVIKGVKSPTSSFAQIGIDLHDLFEQACLGEIENSKEMLAQYTDIWNNYEDTLFAKDVNLYKDMDVPRLRTKLWEQSVTGIERFFNILPTLPKEPFATEEQIIFSINDDMPNVSITMDRIDKVDGELEILDWKTGKAMVGKKLSSDLQAPLYIYAVKQHYNMPVRKFTFYYLKDDSVRTFERESDDIYVCKVRSNEYRVSLTETIREVKSIFSRIKNEEFNVPRNTKRMYFKCKMCGFKDVDYCKGADMQIWYNK